MTCIITGCVAYNGGQWVGGDLHEFAGAYVFNAIVDREDGPRWSPRREDWSHYSMEVDFSLAPDYFERRGVLVAPADQCRLNDAAREYLHV